jgi:hypothetical protein
LSSSIKKGGKKIEDEDEEDYSVSKLKPLISINNKSDTGNSKLTSFEKNLSLSGTGNKQTGLPGGKSGAYGNIGVGGGDPYNFDFPTDGDSKSKVSTKKNEDLSSKNNKKGGLPETKSIAGNNKFDSFASKKQEEDDRNEKNYKLN